MILTKEELIKLYPNTEEYVRIFYESPKSKEDFITNYLPSKLWRLNNLYKIIDKAGDLVTYNMNYAQHQVFSATLIHPRVIILKSRQQGISTHKLIEYFDDGLTHDNLSIGLMAQGQTESSKLLERIKTLWNNMDPDVLTFLGRINTKDNLKEFAFNRDSKIYISFSFRSATLHRLHISEFGKIAAINPLRARETMTGTMQTINPKNPVAIESTAEGDNIFKELWDKAIDVKARGQLAAKDFYPIFLSWVHDPDCVEPVEQSISIDHGKYFEKIEGLLDLKLTIEQKNFWIAQHRELGEEIHQEYPATADEAFAAVKDGTYYARLYRTHVRRKDREVNGLYDAALPVYVMVDLGMNDTMVLFFFQLFENSIRIIDEYCNSGEGLKHYVDELNRVAEEKGYKYETIVLPHDADVRNLDRDGKTRSEILYELGVSNQYVQDKTISVIDDIQLVRENMHRIYVDTSCTYAIECFMKYSKEWDDKFQVWKSKPKHDKYSHGADVIRGIVVYAPEDTLTIGQKDITIDLVKDGFSI